MADPQTSVALNIGSQRIGMAVFEVSKNGGLVLKAYDTESIVADPAMDASRNSQVRVAIADLAQRLKVGKSKVRYAISGQSVLARFVKLPPIQDDNVEQLVTFEAQQQLPFPLDSVVWDYELIQGSAEQEAIIVAIKSDALDEINTAVNDSGLSIAEVDVAPMALYNAFRATYGTPDEPILLMDIGAKSSNLLYIEGNRFFARGIQFGGSSITAAIAKEYGVTFQEAEQQKIANGLVALGGGHTEQLDEQVAALAMVIRNSLSKLPAEIARTTNFYRSQHGGSAPRRVILAGGGANLPYALEFFQEKLNLPVEFFNPVRNVALGKGVDASVVQREGHLMGELVGLGLRGIGKSAINIDLVPAAVEQARMADRRKPFLIGAAAALLAGCAIWAGLQHVAAGKARDEVRTLSETRDSLDPLQAQISGLLKKEEALRQIADSFTSAESDHVFWMDLVSEIRGAFASDAVWVTDIEPLLGYHAVLPSAETAPRPKGSKAQQQIPVVDAKSAAGTSVIKNDFMNSTYGSSSLTAASGGDAVNAVRVTGFWRENPKSQNIVSELLRNLREKSTSFNLHTSDGRGEPVPLKDEQILKKISVTSEDGELGLPFEIVLPLAREVKFK